MAMMHGSRRLAVMGLAFLATAGVFALAGALCAATPTAAEEEQAAAWCAIQALRAELHLADDDLAQMACSEAQAETVLAALIAWYNDNRADLPARRAAARVARRALREAQQKVHIGPRDEALIATLPRLESAAASARADLNRVLDTAACGRLRPARAGPERPLVHRLIAGQGRGRRYGRPTRSHAA